MLKELIGWYNGVLDQWGYWAIGLLMAAESTVLPIPSEVIIPPAAYKAWGSPGLELLGTRYTGWTAEILLVIAGAFGSWLGAAVMYWVARVAGRPLVLRYGKYVFIPPAKIEGAEQWAADYGAFGIFASRLLPVVRHLIGIPAGIVRMNFWKYSLYTLAGATLWSAVLAWLGVKVGGQLDKGEMHKVTLSLLAFVVVVGVLYYFFVHRHMSKKSNWRRFRNNVGASGVFVQARMEWHESGSGLSRLRLRSFANSGDAKPQAAQTPRTRRVVPSSHFPSSIPFENGRPSSIPLPPTPAKPAATASAPLLLPPPHWNR